MRGRVDECEIRLECLELAVKMAGGGQASSRCVIEEAERLFEYATRKTPSEVKWVGDVAHVTVSPSDLPYP